MGALEKKYDELDIFELEKKYEEFADEDSHPDEERERVVEKMDVVFDAKLGSNGRLTIPDATREKWKMSPSDIVTVRIVSRVSRPGVEEDSERDTDDEFGEVLPGNSWRLETIAELTERQRDRWPSPVVWDNSMSSAREREREMHEQPELARFLGFDSSKNEHDDLEYDSDLGEVLERVTDALGDILIGNIEEGMRCIRTLLDTNPVPEDIQESLLPVLELPRKGFERHWVKRVERLKIRLEAFLDKNTFVSTIQ